MIFSIGCLLLVHHTRKMKDPAFMQLRNQKCKVFDKALVPYEPCREDNEIYRMFNLNPPKLIEREDERSEN